MPAFLHPGVYVQEVPRGVRAIEGISTSTAIFVGETERGPLQPTKIKNVAEYERIYGRYLRRTETESGGQRVTMRYAVDAFFANGGGTAYILRAAQPVAVNTEPRAAIRRFADVPTGDYIAASSPGTWANKRVYALVHSSDGVRFRLWVFYQAPGTAARTFVEDWPRLSLDERDDNYVGRVLDRSNYIRWVRPASAPRTTPPPVDFATEVAQPFEVVFDSLPSLGDVDATAGTGGAASFATSGLPALLASLDRIDDASLLVGAPDFWLKSHTNSAVTGWYGGLRTYVDSRPKQDLFLVADLPRQDPETRTVATQKTAELLQDGFTRSSFVGLYFPHVRVADPVGVGVSPSVLLPPSASVAGLFARIDGRRGVWKAPAGVEATLGGITGVQHELLDSHQDDLNPLGVNVIRPVPGAGIVVWGARTSMPSSEWRYVPVRRTAMFLRKSIYNGIQWAVFEPNDEPLWQSLRISVSAFMETQFRNGAFAGASSKDAYFVKCDAQTTTEIDQASGVVNILVGFAPLRPAEFVVVKLSQITKTAA
jgi:uncharacterized protein